MLESGTMQRIPAASHRLLRRARLARRICSLQAASGAAHTLRDIPPAQIVQTWGSAPCTGFCWAAPRQNAPTVHAATHFSPLRSSVSQTSRPAVIAAAAVEQRVPARMQFHTAPELVECLRRFVELRRPTLSDVCEVQVQLQSGQNRATMDARHGNGFAERFLAEDGMAQVLLLLHHHDKHVHREAFRFVRALVSQRWVARHLVGRQFLARLAPLITNEQGCRPADACGLAARLLQQGHEAGFGRDAAAQLLDAGGLQSVAEALPAHQQNMLGQSAQLVRGVAACGPAYRHRLAASDAVRTCVNQVAALAAAASADLAAAIQRQRPPLIDTDLPQLRQAHAGLTDLAAAAAADGPTATGALLSSGLVQALVQMQTPWLDNASAAWRPQSLAALQQFTEQHPTEVRELITATEVSFTPGTSAQTWLSWWSDFHAAVGL